MPRHKDTPGSAADWLKRAKGDLAIAMVPLPPGAFYEDLCFHAQQTAEKALKPKHRNASTVPHSLRQAKQVVVPISLSLLEVFTFA